MLAGETITGVVLETSQISKLFGEERGRDFDTAPVKFKFSPENPLIGMYGYLDDLYISGMGFITYDLLADCQKEAEEVVVEDQEEVVVPVDEKDDDVTTVEEDETEEDVEEDETEEDVDEAVEEDETEDPVTEPDVEVVPTVVTTFDEDTPDDINNLPTLDSTSVTVSDDNEKSTAEDNSIDGLMIGTIVGGGLVVILLLLIGVMLIDKFRKNRKISEVVEFKPVDIEAYKKQKADLAKKNKVASSMP